MTKDEVRKLIQKRSHQHYVYVLKDESGLPFYVGLGQGDRLFQHEEEARNQNNISAKCLRIREIQRSGFEVQYEIDSFHDSTPWHREEELMRTLQNEFQLTNSQRYSAAAENDGIVLRKYAKCYEAGTDVSAIPTDFPYTNTKLAIGPNRPGTRAKVYGRICSILEESPGITGAELVKRLHAVDWSDVKSAYTEGKSRVSGKWLADYIKGGFYKKNQFIRVYESD